MAQFPIVNANGSIGRMPEANADWRSAISGLFDDYASGQQYGEKRNIQTGRREVGQQPIGRTPDGAPDYMTPAQRLLAIGDLEGARLYSGLAQTSEDTAYRRQRDAVGDQRWGQTFGLQQQNAARSQENADRNYNLAAGAATRRDIPTGYRMSADGTRLEIIPGGPADPAVIGAVAQAKGEGRPPRPLPTSAVNDLVQNGAMASTIGQLNDTFKPDYAGQPVIGEAANLWGRTFGGSAAPQAEWWQNYQGQKNLVRNKLFGSALTAPEKSEFEKADISPGMSPQVIQANLARQKEVATRAAQKLARAYLSQGYSTEVIEGALGIPLGNLGITTPGEAGTRPNTYNPPAPAPDGGKNQERAPMGDPMRREPARGTLAPGAVVNGYTYQGGNPNDPASWVQQ